MIANKNVGWDQIRIQFGNIERGIVKVANGAAVDARKESKDLQETILSKKRCETNKKKAKEKASKKAATSNKRKTAGKENGSVKSRKKKTENTNSKARTIMAIYGHELYRGEDYEKCGSEWFYVKYGNGSRELVNALVVAEEAPGLGADYVVDHCMDSEEDIKNYGQWYDKMKYASDRAMEV
jgi:hypothetical protein